MSITTVDVLILSSSRDFATDIVCHRLSELGTSFLRLNIEQLPDIAFVLDPVRAVLGCRFEGREWRVHASSLKSVWWRVATFRRDAFGHPIEPARQLQFSQWPAFFRGLMLFEEARWYNFPSATYRAESKPYQLRKAAALGFSIPETRITNDRNIEISSELGDPVALKSIDTIYLVEEHQQHFTYTNVVSWKDCADDNFHLLPATCQTLLEPKLDLRVTVIGDRLWCHAITIEDEPISGDWRVQPKSRLVYRKSNLTAAQSTRCLHLVCELGLKFAAVDFLRSNGEDWFIEVNPTGEWAWLDSDGEIANAIAQELSK